MAEPHSSALQKLYAYLPQDRLQALVHGTPLPDRTHGAALFADISGFTPLTEQLTEQLGARRGIEELSRQVNAVYAALIGAVERCGGSVVNFAGDSVTCWFAAGAGQPVQRAVACAQVMQSAMLAFPDLGLKVAVTSGPARRFVVGDPQVQQLDALAGATIARLATGEGLASRGEILLDEPTAAQLASPVTVGEWRLAATDERFAVLAAAVMTPAGAELPSAAASPLYSASSLDSAPSLSSAAPLYPAPPLYPGPPLYPAASAEILKPWLLPVVFEREYSEHSAFLTELRPAVALFLRFTGLDYDRDDHAGEQLDALVRRAHAILAHFQGAFMQLTIGDKGSYLYACFGAPLAHEDDALRAVQAAVALAELPDEFPFLQPLQIGLSRGMMRTGAYGGPTRRTYGALGDDTNLAARLMTAAAPGEILVSGRVHNLIAGAFNCDPRPPLPMKGKAEPLAVFAVLGPRRQRALRLEEPHYALPMLGRTAELAQIDALLAQAQGSQGQVIGITAEAGLGKSRLIAEVIRLAHRRGFTGYGGACESTGRQAVYRVWRPIWQAFFNLDPASPSRRQLRSLAGEIEDQAPDRTAALPVLAQLLDLPIPDNDFTRPLEPLDRHNLLAALLEDCLKSAAVEQPLLLVLEDLHWIDPLSLDLLETLARACAGAPVCFVLAYRPLAGAGLRTTWLTELPDFTSLELPPLNGVESAQLIRAKLAQLFPERASRAPAALVSELTQRAEGNPFFIEELLNYLRDRGLDPAQVGALQPLDLPSSLQVLILSRIDQLPESQQITLKAASIIGRAFSLDWLNGYYPELGTAAQVQPHLAELCRLELIASDENAAGPAYLFKHMLTHEVAYEGLPYTTRAQLHERLAAFLENLASGYAPLEAGPAQAGPAETPAAAGPAAAGHAPLAPPLLSGSLPSGSLPSAALLDVLAFHYGRSANRPKQREYLKKAADAARAAYANAAALEYYERLLPLLSEPAEQVELHLGRAEVLQLLGRWEAAEADFHLALAVSAGLPPALARSKTALGRLYRARGDYAAALEWLAEAQADWLALADPLGQGQALIEMGMVSEHQGDYALARARLEAGLALARAQADHPLLTQALLALGRVELEQGNFPAARAFGEESLALARASGDKRNAGAALNILARMAYHLGDYAAARSYGADSLLLRREIGDKQGVAISLGNLGMIAADQAEYTQARALYEECLAIYRALGDRRGVVLTLNNLGVLASGMADYPAARRYNEEGLELARQLGDLTNVALALTNLGVIAAEQAEYSAARGFYEEALALSRQMGVRRNIASTLLNLGYLACEQSDYAAARAFILESLALFHEMDDHWGLTYSLVGLAAAVAGSAAGGPEAGRAVQLAAAAETLRQSMDLVLASDGRRLFERALAAARRLLTSAEFAAAWQQGAGLAAEEVRRLAGY